MSSTSYTDCPRCAGPIAHFEGDLGGSSRIVHDRSVTICGPCATDEAVRDAAGLAPIPFDEWPMQDEHLTWGPAPTMPS